MDHRILAVGSIASAALLLACGTSSTTEPTTIQAYAAAAQNVATDAASYGAQAAGMTTLAACTNAQGTYDGQVRPQVMHLQADGPAMDAMMGSMNHPGMGDMDCSANAMMAELDRHRAAACNSTVNMAPNVAEAQAHVATMTQWANHELGRSHDLATMEGQGMGMMSGGTTTGHCVHNLDGSYTLQP